MMEEALLRFPHLGTQIFESLDDSNLAKSRKVARSWLKFIDSEEMPWKRIQKNWESSLQEYPCKEGQTKLLVALITGQNKMFEIIFDAEKDNLKSWNNLMDIPLKLLKSLDKIQCLSSIESVTPYHLAAAIGNLNACQIMFNCFGNPNWGTTPLHFAAHNGHMDICQFLIERLEDKNPKDGFDGSTPLHEAAKQGHLEICQLIMKSIKTNPSDIKTLYGLTPLDFAKMGSYDMVAEYFSSFSNKKKRKSKRQKKQKKN